MTFFYGFFQVIFPPLGIAALLGICLFFLTKNKSEKYYYPLLFIIIVLTVISLWRIPVIISKRYAMPALVPGLVVGVYAIMLLPDILKKNRIQYSKWITRLIIAGILIACVAKTLRVQENKPYLHELPKALHEDCRKSNVAKTALLIFGDPGGHIDFNNDVKIINVENRHLNDRFADSEYQLAILDKTSNPNILKIRYPHLYLLSVEDSSGSFSNAWEKKYGEKPQLIYEYIRPKDQVAYRLYRVSSEYKAAWLDEIALNQLLDQNNMLKNGDFSQKSKVPPDDKIIEILKKRGIELKSADGLYLPSDWYINPNAGWSKKCSPVEIELIPAIDGVKSRLQMSSRATISLFSNTKLYGGYKYVIVLDVYGVNNSAFSIYGYRYADNKSQSFHKIIAATAKEQMQREIAILDLSDFKGYALLRLYLAGGSISVDKIYVVQLPVLLK